MADEKLDYFKLMRDFWDYAFKNPECIKPNHCAVYAYAVETCNRLGWKEKFGFPTSMVLEAVGIKSYSVYKKTFDDLVSFGFFEVVEYSKNQYSANIIALKENYKAPVKAPVKAHEKHLSKHVSTHLTTHSEYNKTLKQENSKDHLKPLNENLKNLNFGKELLESPGWVETIAMQNRILLEEVAQWIESFNTKLFTECDVKISRQDYAGHFSRWLSGEVSKTKKTNQNGKPEITNERNR
ncbi:hypothetical protein [Flavobacterium anhuiense]|uniref:DUF7833 domain-containing protein n=1 Tax=Flavobacterium anhuiense TaxID=459526 RepID=UPI00202669F3|nr:hypothetical protein [Flavobacterium anhuiense]URM37181.1 hypothetical protein LLY39_00890 [Flavobacterium anhuiense]